MKKLARIYTQLDDWAAAAQECEQAVGQLEDPAGTCYGIMTASSVRQANYGGVVEAGRGDLVLADLTPEGYRELDRTPLIAPTSPASGRDLGVVHWSHPAYANRHIVVRNDRKIVRANLAAR